MNNLQMSLENLIATNNGLFKSDAQAKFLLSEIKKEFGNVFVTSVYGNSVKLTYIYDNTGIVEKTNTSVKKGTQTVVWKRKVQGVLSIDEAKQLKHIKKSIKDLKKSIEVRDAAYANGEYKFESLYFKSDKEDHERLAVFEKLLSEFTY